MLKNSNFWSGYYEDANRKASVGSILLMLHVAWNQIKGLIE